MSQTDPSASQYFEKWSSDLFSEHAAYQKNINTFTAGLVRGDTLDLGCGARVYYHIGSVSAWVGADVSSQLLDNLQFFGGQEPRVVKKLHQSCLDLEMADESFDTVCAVFLLHHLARNSRRESRRILLELFRNVHRMLRPGGRFLIIENAARSPEYPYRWAFPFLYRLARKLFAVEIPYFWTRKEWQELLTEVAFTDITLCQIPMQESICNPVLGFSSPPWFGDWLQRITILCAVR